MEIWKDIPGYYGDYQASTLGRIKSFWHNKEKILKLHINYYRSGYLSCMLYKDGKSKRLRINRLIALTFINNTENKLEVNHKNGITDDNRLENLEWCTKSENELHKYQVLGYKNVFQTNHPGKGKIGKECINSKSVGLYKNGKLIKTYYSIKEASDNTLFSYSTILRSLKGIKLRNLEKFIGLTWKYEN